MNNNRLREKSEWKRASLCAAVTLVILSVFFVKAESIAATTTGSTSVSRSVVGQPMSQNSLSSPTTTPSATIVGNQGDTITCPQTTTNSYINNVTQSSPGYWSNGGVLYGSEVQSSSCSWVSCDNYWLSYGFASVWMVSPSTYSIDCINRPSGVTYSITTGLGGGGGSPSPAPGGGGSPNNTGSAPP